MDQLHTRLDALEQQMRTLHRRLRRWRGLAGGLLGLAVLTWALPAGLAKEDSGGGQQGLEQRVAALESLLKHFSRKGNDITITGANLHLVNGLGRTACGSEQEPIPNCPNGLGNLLVGYNEPRPEGLGENIRTGSHNVVVGQEHNFSRFGGVVVGRRNAISGDFAAITGGVANRANGKNAVVSGGADNSANGQSSSVAGGNSNTASGDFAVVSGGAENMAIGLQSAISGGFQNGTGREAAFAVVGGGMGNAASGSAASVSGGEFNTASGFAASVSGGSENTASGDFSAVSGGQNRTAAGDFDWVAGSLFADE